MESTKEQTVSSNLLNVPKHFWIPYYLFPPTVFLVQYTIAFMAIYGLCVQVCPIEINVIMILYLLLSLLMVSFWYRTFFDKLYVGAGHLLSATWSENEIQFQGVFFDITIHFNNIVSFIVDNERIFGMQRVRIKFKFPHGRKETVVIRRTDIYKTNDLISFLEQKGIKGEWKRRSG